MKTAQQERRKPRVSVKKLKITSAISFKEARRLNNSSMGLCLSQPFIRGIYLRQNTNSPENKFCDKTVSEED